MASVEIVSTTAKIRRHFRLPEEDEEYLDARGLPWETIIDGSIRWVIVHDLPVPEGYNEQTVRAAILISIGYPDAQLDMVYFLPHLARIDQKHIAKLSLRQIEGLNWQRWSRHRTGKNPWRPGLDNIATHLTLVDDWLQRELRIR